MRCLRPLNEIPKSAMAIFLQLLRERNKHVATTYTSSNPEASPYLNSIYCSADCFRKIQEDPQRDDMDYLRGTIAWTCVRRIYFTVRTMKPTGDSWLLLVACHNAKRIYCVVPSVAQHVLHNDAQLVEFAQYSALLAPTLQKFFPAHVGAWPCSSLPADYLEPVDNKHDSGIMVLAAAYLLSLDCPLIFKPADADNMRSNFAFWCTKGELPI